MFSLTMLVACYITELNYKTVYLGNWSSLLHSFLNLALSLKNINININQVQGVQINMGIQ